MHVPPAVAIATRMYLPKMASELGEVQLPNMAGGAGGCSADAVGLGDGNEAAVRVGVERVALGHEEARAREHMRAEPQRPCAHIRVEHTQLKNRR